MANTEIEEDLWRIQKYTVGGLRNIATTETKPRERLLEHILIRMYTCKCMKMEISWLAFLMYKYPCVCLSKELKITIKNNVKQKLIQYRSF